MESHEVKGVALALLPGGLSPAGHVVVALPDDESAGAMAKALLAHGFASSDVRRFSAIAMSRWLKSLLPDAGRAIGYGPLVPGLRNFYILALEQCSWLVVGAPDEAAARIVTEEARRAGARSAIRYRPPTDGAASATVNATTRDNEASASAGALALG